MPSTSSVRRNPPGCSSTCRWSGIPATASGLTSALAEGREQARGARPPDRGGRLSAPGCVWAAEQPAVPPRPPRPGGAAADLAATILSLYRPGAGSAPLAHQRRATASGGPHHSPYDLEARYSTKRDTHWVGYKLHLTETCDADQPDLITQVSRRRPPRRIVSWGPHPQDLARRDSAALVPTCLDSGYVDADFLVTAQTQHQIDVVGPPFGLL